MATPRGTNVDAERARLRAEGYTDAEISRILINQASSIGSQQPAGAAPCSGENCRAFSVTPAPQYRMRAAQSSASVATSGIFSTGRLPPLNEPGPAGSWPSKRPLSL